MQNFTLSALYSLFLTFLAAPLATALPGYPNDTSKLFATSFTDPNYPEAVIGDREVFLSFSPPSNWSNLTVKLEHSDRSEAFLLDGVTFAATVVEVPVIVGSSNDSVSYILPWESPADSSILDKPNETYSPGTEVFYRWRFEYTESGAAQTVWGDLHVFTMPRRVTLAILGDSYGSGEGAPNYDPALGSHWQYFNQGSRGHRSPISGQELAVAEFFAARPHLAYDYVNLSSSGAIAVDIYSNRSQHQRLLDAGVEPDKPDVEFRAIQFPQAERLSDWLTARDYSYLDAIILSCGGNDFGFEAILKAYLGINGDILAEAAVDGLRDPRCIAVGLVPVTGIVNYLACVITHVVYASQADHTFKDPYVPGSASAAITSSHWSFAQYANRLSGEYDALANEFANNLRNGQTPVSACQIFATSYPFPLKDSTSYYESIAGLLSDETLVEFKLNPTSYSVLDEALTLRIDFSHLTKIPIGISPGETSEASLELAPPADVSRPSPGGMNHYLEDFVAANNSRYSSQWRLVKVNNFLPANTGLSFSGRHFNTIGDALRLAGPNHLTNAFHPNARGHAGHYRPAILNSLQLYLNEEKLAKSARGEGLGNALAPLVDLAFRGLPTLDYDYESGNLQVHGVVENRGNIGSPAGLHLEVLLNDSTPNPSFQALDLPALDVGEIYDFTLELEVPAQPVRPDLPYQCAGAPFPGFEAFEDRDHALRYFFSQGLATFKLHLNPSLQVNEINTSNNVFEQDLELRPDINEGNLPEVVPTVLAQLSGILGTPIETVDYPLLVASEDVRIFFGFFSPELQSGLTVSEILNETITFERNYCFAANLGTTLPPIPTYSREPAGGLRPLCLFPLPSTDCARTENSLVRDSLGRLQSYREFIANAPRDGRNAVISAILDEQLGSLIGNPLLEVALDTPQLNTGLQIPNENEPISSPTQIFVADSAEGVLTSTLSLGTVAGADDILGNQLLTKNDGEVTPVTPLELPQDGREIHATVTSYHEDGSLATERYTYQTVSRNALLTSPAPNSLLVPGISTVSWQAPAHGTAGPVTAYSLAVGTFPGTGDIIPGSLEAGSPAKAKISKNNKNNPAPQALQFGPEETNFPLNNLPSDGRAVYITIGTRRDNEWGYEVHRRLIGPATNAGLLSPRTDQLIHSRESLVIAPGSRRAEAYRFTLGTSQNGSDLFDSGYFDEEELTGEIPILLESFTPQLDEDNLPLPIYATLESAREPQSDFERYLLVPSPNSSLFLPVHGEPLSLEGETTFAWSHGAAAEGYRLQVFAGLPEQEPVFDEIVDPDVHSLSLALEGIADESSSIVVVLTTLRSPESETIASGSTATHYFLNTGQFNFYDDEIDDLWQLEYFGAENPDGLANADPDGDGCNNLCEFLARTNPNDPDDFFQPLILTSPEGKPVGYQIDLPVPSTNYQIRRSSDLRTWNDSGPALSPNPVDSGFVVPLPQFPITNETEQFFRLELEP